MEQKITTIIQDRNGVAFEPNKAVPFTGLYIEKFENGQVEFQCNYENGISNGLLTRWYKNGLKCLEKN